MEKPAPHPLLPPLPPLTLLLCQPHVIDIHPTRFNLPPHVFLAFCGACLYKEVCDLWHLGDLLFGDGEHRGGLGGLLVLEELGDVLEAAGEELPVGQGEEVSVHVLVGAQQVDDLLGQDLLASSLLFGQFVLRDDPLDL